MRTIVRAWWRWRNRRRFDAEVAKLAQAMGDAKSFVIGVTPPKGYTFHEVVNAAKTKATVQA